MRTLVCHLILALGPVLLAPCAGAAPQAPAPQGLTVVRDADSGELRAPTAAELRALQRPATATGRQRADQPQLVTGARGESSVVLGERALVYSVIQRGPDGKLDQRCVSGAHAASHAITPPAPAGAPAPALAPAPAPAPALQGEHRHDHH